MADVKPLKIDPAGPKVPERFETGDTVPVVHGGTGLAAITTGTLLVGNGTSAPTLIGPGTAGQVPTSNGTTITMQDPVTGNDLSSQVNANAGTLAPGTPVYEKATANNIDKAQGNAVGTSFVLGLTIASLATTVSGVVRTAGRVVLTTTQWDAITGQTGGLTLGAIYYLDTATAGKMTTSPTDATGNFLAQIGKALSTTDFLVAIRNPIGL